MGAKPDLIARAISLIQEKKGEDIVLIDLRTTTIPGGFFLIAQGENPIHVRALAEELLAKMPISPQHKEGLGEGRWALLDYGEFVVHLFDRVTRSFYDLDGLWSDRLVRRW